MGEFIEGRLEKNLVLVLYSYIRIWCGVLCVFSFSFFLLFLFCCSMSYLSSYSAIDCYKNQNMVDNERTMSPGAKKTKKESECLCFSECVGKAGFGRYPWMIDSLFTGGREMIASDMVGCGWVTDGCSHVLLPRREYVAIPAAHWDEINVHIYLDLANIFACS